MPAKFRSKNHREQVKQNVYLGLMGGFFSKRKLAVKNVSLRVFNNTALAEFYWHFDAILKSDGSALTTEGRETLVYHKERGRWPFVHVHYLTLIV